MPDSSAQVPQSPTTGTGVEETSLGNPRLRDDFQVPQHGLGRVDALVGGLVGPWVVFAPDADRARVKAMHEPSTPCSVHLLTDGTRWAVAVIYNRTWLTSEFRRAVVASALTHAVVAESVTGMVQKFMNGSVRSTPVEPGRRPLRNSVRWDVLGLLLGLEYPERDGDQFLLALNGDLPRMEERFNRLGHERAQRSAVAHIETLMAALERRGIHRGWEHRERLLSGVMSCVSEHWDANTGTVLPAYADAEELLLRVFFGDLLDDVRTDIRRRT